MVTRKTSPSETPVPFIHSVFHFFSVQIGFVTFQIHEKEIAVIVDRRQLILPRLNKQSELSFLIIRLPK